MWRLFGEQNLDRARVHYNGKSMRTNSPLSVNFKGTDKNGPVGFGLPCQIFLASEVPNHRLLWRLGAYPCSRRQSYRRAPGG